MPRYFKREYTIPLDTETEINVWFSRYGHKIVEFSIVLRKKFLGRWYYIRRCDNAKKHDRIPHCHVYSPEEEYVFFFGSRDDDPGEIMTEIINDLKKNFSNYSRSFN